MKNFLNKISKMDDDYIPHQNLEDPDYIIANSKLVSNDIFANSADNFKPLNQTIKEQNAYLTNINNDIEKNSKDFNNDINILDKNTDNLQFTIHQKLGIVSSQLLQAKERIKYLNKENLSLKNIIANKDKIISDFEELSIKSKYKFEKMEMIINNLKQQLQQKGNDNLNNNNNNFNNNIRENINSFNNNKNNSDIFFNLQNIQDDLDNIENDYLAKLREKDCCIEQLNYEIINIYQEYMKLSDVLEEFNYLIKNSDYSELKTELNCLLREKEILLREKERNHMEIITLREKFLHRPEYRLNNEGEQGKVNELMNIYNMKEKNYLEEIEMLKKNLREKILEIEELKKEEENIIREYELKIANIMNNN